MSKFCSLFSSSSANCTYISSSNSAILIDAGASAKQIITSCEAHGLSTQYIKAIFVTHEHIDHVKGVRVLSKKLGVPVYATRETIDAIIEKNLADDTTDFRSIEEQNIKIDEINVTCFDTPHDCAHSVGFNIFLPSGRKISTCTDLGVVTENVYKALLGSDLVLLESNHDISMLRYGPYVYSLKQRILSNIGHLPNTQCADTAKKLLKCGTTRFVLGHLSRQNNTPQLAFEETKKAFDSVGAKQNIDYTLTVAGDNNKVILL